MKLMNAGVLEGYDVRKLLHSQQKEGGREDLLIVCVCGDQHLPSSSFSSTMDEWRSVAPVHSQGRGCEFQENPRDLYRGGD